MVPTRDCGNRETTRAVTDNAYPKLAYGLPITEMEPQAVPLGMEAT